jgi:hypothetical protein
MKVRPTTVMVGIAVLVAIGAVTLAWLPGDDSTTVGQPSSLPITLGGGDRAEAAMASTIPTRTTYRRGPGVPDLKGTAAAWTFPTATVDPSTIRRLAAALGVAGDVRSVPEGRAVGDDNGVHLVVASTPDGNWVFTNGEAGGAVWSCASSGEATTSSGGVTTSSVEILPSPPDADGRSPDSPSNSTATPAPAPVMPSGCSAPPPPAGVPGETAAESAARRIITAAGLDLTGAVFVVHADEWSASVTAAPVLDGTPTTGLDTVITFGGEGKVVYAMGRLATPTRADTYPLIGTAAAIDRLQRGVDLMGPQLLGGTPMRADATIGVPVPQPGSAEGGGSSGSAGSGNGVTTETAQAPATTYPPNTTFVPPDAPTGGPYPCPSAAGTAPGTAPVTPPVSTGNGSTTTVTAPGGGSEPGCAPPSCGAAGDCSYPDPYPGPTVVTEPPTPVDRTVTITSAEIVLVATPGTDGSTWLVPAYLLKGDDSGSWLVLAIDESFLAPPPVNGSGNGGGGGGASPPGSMPPTTGTITAVPKPQG